VSRGLSAIAEFLVTLQISFIYVHNGHYNTLCN